MAEANSTDNSNDRVGIFFHDVEASQLQPGDHIYCYPKRTLKKRHGIYIEQREVIYYANAENGSKPVARVCSCTLHEFTEGGKVRLVAYQSGTFATIFKLSGTTYNVKCKSTDQVIKVAKYYLRYPSRWLSYNLKRNFSESFAYFCKTGEYKDDGKKRAPGDHNHPYYDIDDNLSDDTQEEDLRPSDIEEDDSKMRAGKFFHNVERRKLKPGDHIYCYRCGKMYSHHGIYLGEEEMEVIHFSNEERKEKKTARVCFCSLDEFTDGKQLRLVAYNVELRSKVLKIVKRESAHMRESKPAHEVIETAKYYCENPEKWGEYKLTGNNCESFATFCKTGKRFSSQVFQ